MTQLVVKSDFPVATLKPTFLSTFPGEKSRRCSRKFSQNRGNLSLGNVTFWGQKSTDFRRFRGGVAPHFTRNSGRSRNRGFRGGDESDRNLAARTEVTTSCSRCVGGTSSGVNGTNLINWQLYELLIANVIRCSRYNVCPY